MTSQKLQRCVNAKRPRMPRIKASAELKLALFPTRSPLPFAALPSISLTHQLDCADLGRFGIRVSSFLRHSAFGVSLMQIVHFDEPNSSGVVYPAHDGGVITRSKVGDDSGFVRVCWSVPAVS